MKVYKFGGASVKDAMAVKNVAKIVKEHAEEDLWLVVSAMGKTTNALESLLEAYRQGLQNKEEIQMQIKSYHQEILDGLFPFSGHDIFLELNKTILELKEVLETRSGEEYDKIYDTVVAFGEQLSSLIVSAYLDKESLANTWVDARSIIRTDSSYREGRVDLQKTGKLIKQKWEEIIGSTSMTGKGLLISQGFIGSNGKDTITLGREGSDYTGAILAWSLGATELSIWKDVPGMLNADPKFFPDATRIPSLSYQEAIELSYYGASVIHPKTLKPLQNKGIPLYVRSFKDPHAEGTVIHHDESKDHSQPSFIFKQSQVLISIIPQDFSFIMEENMSHIFALLAKYGLKANLIQNSALSFSICIDDRGKRVEDFMDACQESYKTLYNQGLSLLTVRHYDEQILEELLKNREVLVEQRSRRTARFVLKGGFNPSSAAPR